MSWHCSRALVAEFSAASCLDGEPSALLNTTLTPEAFYWPDKTTEHSRLSRFGMTSEPLTEDRGAELLTWFLAASLARTSASREKATDWTASAVGSGRKWLGSLARYDHDSRSWKTAQRSLLGDWAEFSGTWPRWGSMRNGECWERTTVVPLTSANEFGLWPTPVADDTSSRSKKYAQGGTPLSMAVKLWPTPTVCGNYNRPGASATSGLGLASAVRMFPTPVARDYRSPGRSRLERTGSRAGDPLPQIVGGPLNPDWVEWLMGWPIGWTDLKPLGTAKSAEWLQQHGDCSEAAE